MTCQACRPATALARFIVGSHHQASGARVRLIHEVPSGLGALWMRTSISFSLSPCGISQKSSVYFFAGVGLVVKGDVGKPAVDGKAANDADIIQHEGKTIPGAGVGEGEHTVRAALGDDGLDGSRNLLVGEILGCGICRAGGHRQRRCRRRGLQPFNGAHAPVPAGGAHHFTSSVSRPSNV